MILIKWIQSRFLFRQTTTTIIEYCFHSDEMVFSKIINILQTNLIWKWPIDFMQQHLIDKSMEKKYEFLSLLNSENPVHVQLFFYMPVS